ncbi:MAG: hypothetical protein FWD47_07250 [Treponema sp.]|nr:hypothetical protein [Treponema sp.]
MEKTQLMNLELLAPINYIEDFSQSRYHGNYMSGGAEDAELMKNDDELLLCFEINHIESNNIEPKPEQFLGNLVFIGKKNTSNPLRASVPPCEKNLEITLPAGNYLFSQQRADRVLNQEEWLDMTIEQQKEGLWQRNKLEARFYVRFLNEDGAFVTQVFRPVK